MSDHPYKDRKCPNCGHPILDHVLELGCMVGWDQDDEGVAQAQGCACPLTLAEDYDPPHQKMYPTLVRRAHE